MKRIPARHNKAIAFAASIAATIVVPGAIASPENVKERQEYFFFYFDIKESVNGSNWKTVSKPALSLLEGIEGTFRISKGAGDPLDPSIGEVDIEMCSFQGLIRKAEDGTIVLDAAYNIAVIEECSRSRISARLKGKRIIEKLVLGKEYGVIVKGNDSGEKGRRVRFDFTVQSKQDY